MVVRRASAMAIRTASRVRVVYDSLQGRHLVTGARQEVSHTKSGADVKHKGRGRYWHMWWLFCWVTRRQQVEIGR
jgi:hypothetical protein